MSTPSTTVAPIASLFPTLQGAPWEIEPFTDWAIRRHQQGRMSEGERHAVLFALHVHSPTTLIFHGLGSFSLSTALGVWDRAHRDAFFAWADALGVDGATGW